MPLEQRRRLHEGHNGLNSDNCLLFAMGNRWLSHLTHVRPSWAELCLDSTPIPSRPNTPGLPEDAATAEKIPFSLRSEIFNNRNLRLKHFTADVLARWIRSGQ